MKSALIILSLLSCIFAKYESNLNEDPIVEAKTIKYPTECTAFPKDTKFDIEYKEEKTGLSGKGNFKLSLSNVNVLCDFGSKKGNCTTQDDVNGEGELKIATNSIEVKKEETKVATVTIPDTVNVKAEKFNYNYAAPSFIEYQNLSFVNETEVIEAAQGIQIKFAKELKEQLKVYIDEGKKEELQNCTLNKDVIQCPVNKTIFALDPKDNKTEKNYTIYVENACGDLYNEKILVGVKWQSSHYVKALGLLSLLLVFIL